MFAVQMTRIRNDFPSMSVQPPKLSPEPPTSVDVTVDVHLGVLTWEFVQEDFCWHTQRHRVGRYLDPTGHHCGRTYERMRMNNRVMQHNRPRPHERMIVDSAALEMGKVANRAEVPNDRLVKLGAMQHGAVLDRRALTNADVVIVGSEHSMRPH